MRDKLKFKVIVGFTLATLAVIVASFITITNFLQLQNSVNELSLPDVKLLKLNKMLTDISEAESSIRSYTLTENEEYLNKYYQTADIIRSELNSLKDLTYNSIDQYNKIDSISKLWDSKINIFDNYIELKSRARNKDFSKQAIMKISNEAIDSVTTTTTTKKTEISEKVVMPPAVSRTKRIDSNGQEVTDAKKDTKGLLGGLINKLFTKKEETEIPIIKIDTPKTFTQKQVVYDTVVTQDDSHEIVSRIITILSDLQQEENRFRNLMTNREFELLQNDVLIMGNIRTMIKELQNEQLALAREKTKTSKSIAQKSITTIFIIGLIGLLVSILFIYLIIGDITKSNYYKSKLEKAKRKAERLAKVKEEFLANMSHEIRTPLSAIIGFTNQLSGTGLKDKQKYYLQAVQNSSEHLLNTVNDILDFSKIESGQLNLENIPFNLDDQITDVFNAFKIKAEEKNIFLKIEKEEDLNVALLGDPFRLKQILYNLVGNAIKFTQEGGVIIKYAYHLNKKDVNLKLEVIDTGIGISKKQLSTIFRGFHQADSSITRKYGGTGLGLAITKKLIDLLKGKISVSSTVNKGSSFTVELNYEVSEEYELQELEHIESFDPSALLGKTVLVVDDDEFNLLLLHTILNKWGMQIELASNGKEAYNLMMKNRYDIVLSDIQMPELSGIDLVNKIKKDSLEYKDIPILAITANVTGKTFPEFNDFILKPFEESNLYSKISKALNIEMQLIDKGVQEVSVNNNKSTISLKDIEVFADGDVDMVENMVTDLIQNCRKHLYQMNQAIQKKDMLLVADLAHKMQPSFGHIKANEIVRILKLIEDHNKNNLSIKKISSLVSEINEQSREIFICIEEQLAGIKSKPAKSQV